MARNGRRGLGEIAWEWTVNAFARACSPNVTHNHRGRQFSFGAKAPFYISAFIFNYYMFTSINAIFPSSNNKNPRRSPTLLYIQNALTVLTIILCTIDIELRLHVNEANFLVTHLSILIPTYLLNLSLLFVTFFQLRSHSSSPKSRLLFFKTNGFTLISCVIAPLPVSLRIPIGSTEHDVSLLIYPLVLCRLIFVLDLVAHWATDGWFESDIIKNACARYQVKDTKTFLIRYLLKEYPMSCLLVLWICSTIIFGYLVRIYIHDQNYQDYNSIWNCMWLISISMTTVGYGDFYAVTIPARIVSAISIVCGIFIISLLLDIKLKLFTKHEETCLEMIENKTVKSK